MILQTNKAAFGSSIKMNIHQKKLSILNTNICITGHMYADAVRHLLSKGKLKLIPKVRDKKDRWCNHDIPYSDRQSTCAYNDCLSAGISSNGILSVYVYDGDSFSGQPTSIRCTYNFSGEWWLLEQLSKSVDWHFRLYASGVLCDEEEIARSLKVDAIEQRLLAEILS